MLSNSIPSSFLEFQCGIKNDTLGPDDDNLRIELLGFLNPEISSNLQSNHPNLNSVPKIYSVMFDNIGIHLTLEKFILTRTSKANPFAHFWWKFSNSIQAGFWNFSAVSKTM